MYGSSLRRRRNNVTAFSTDRSRFFTAPPAPGGALLFLMLCSILYLLCPQRARADMLSLETGRGFHRSTHSDILYLRYHWDAPALFTLPGYYEALLAGWNGRSRAAAVGIARSAQWSFNDRYYLDGSAGVAWLDKTTRNLGTRFQFAFRLAVGRRFDDWELSIGYEHFSNGKLFFNWDGPNNGENFGVIRVGYLF